jgi:hypothetical protein
MHQLLQYRRVGLALSCLFVLHASSLASNGFASIVQTDTTINGDDVAIPVSAIDLINQPSSTVSSTGYTPFSSGGFTTDDDNLNNGSQGISGAIFPAALATIAFDLDGTWTSTFTLDVSLSPAGYDITQIDTIAGWVGSRSGQTYELFYSVVGDAGFTSLGTFTIADPGTGSTRISLTDNTGTIATGVDAVQFSFTPTSTEDVYREIDVFGIPSAVVPEPGTGVLLMGLASIALLARRQRRRSAARR